MTHYINVTIWSLAGLYLTIAILLNISVVQAFVGTQVANALSQKLATKVGLGRVDIGIFNRIIIDDVCLLDQQNKEMLRASRVSAKIDYLELLRGHISISSAQLFGMKASLYKPSAHAPANFQFVLDALASKDTTTHKPLDLELKSLIIRHGEVSYDQHDAPRRPSFDLKHLHIRRLSAHLVLNTLQDDSLNLHVKRLSLTERSGLDIRSLTFRLTSYATHALLKDFELQLPASRLQLGNITATWQRQGKSPQPASLRYDGSILESSITPRDMAAFVPATRKMTHPVWLRARFSGTTTGLQLHRLDAVMPHRAGGLSFGVPAYMHLSAQGYIRAWKATPQWSLHVDRLMIDREGMNMLSGNIPDVVERMRYLSFRGEATGYGRNLEGRGTLKSGAGDADIVCKLRGDSFSGHLDTRNLALDRMLDNSQLGVLAADIGLAGNIRQQRYQARGTVSRIDYNGYSYRQLTLDGSYDKGTLDGQFNIADPNLSASFDGTLNLSAASPAAHLTAVVSHLNPAALRLMEGRLANAVYSADIAASMSGNSINTAVGTLKIARFAKRTAAGTYTLDSLSLRAGNNRDGHYLTMRSDFADIDLAGHFDYTTLAQSLKNAIASKLPSIQQLTPIRYRKTRDNDFTVRGTVRRSDWLRELLNINLQLPQPVRLMAAMSHQAENIEANIYAPRVVYNDQSYKDISVIVSSPDNRLNADISGMKLGSNGTGTEYRIEASASDDRLASVLSIDNHAREKRLSGRLNSVMQFARSDNGAAEAHVSITPSTLSVGDSTFTIHPSTVVYSKDRLEVNHFLFSGGNQHIRINGVTTRNAADSLLVDLDHVNVEYLLNLVNFHAVDFSGHASGRAWVSRLFDQPQARASVEVDQFRFQNGRMGTLYARVGWNRDQQQIDIDAQAVDTLLSGGTAPRLRTTDISGYVSPKRNYIDLGIAAHNTRGEFIESFCASFMNRPDITANGMVRLWGDLGDLNLTGQLVVNGSVGITPLNTRYALHNDTIRCLVNEIQFANDTIYDRNGNTGVVTGSLYHDHLSNLSYDIRTRADNLLAYDWGPSYGSTFYGTVYGTGEVNIKGRSGEVNIDVDVTPNKGSQVVYDVSSPDAIGSREFIHWARHDSVPDTIPSHRLHLPFSVAGVDAADIPTDIRINFLINTTPDATLKLIMDKNTGDYIDLNGSGGIRAAYYNKGGLDIFGNYLIDHGVYKLTIQNIIKRDFVFSPGGTIVFGGNPYAATLNLTAQYMVNSVSLSDLQIGRSFSSNNIRVNCIMNITGTPAAPQVDFSLDLPTVSNEAKQMIYSLINSEEEMNQQVLYLLAVGRFYAQSNNNATAGGAAGSQTSLAMQSILSGQISQQLNSVLNSVVKNVNWNFGANISTGDEGWNNAEYEGLLSGRMLNNRLIFNGQFGYRDNNRATTSFIGDFDLRYLIFPNGNLSVHVYNQTNDRYFTRNSLNTQGIGFILKKDFDNWKSLFRWKKKRRQPVTETKK